MCFRIIKNVEENEFVENNNGNNQIIEWKI